MEKFTQIDISGDAGLRVMGNSPEELFENAAAGMYNLITNVSEIKGRDLRKIVLKADNFEDSLVQWLNELIFLFDAYSFIGTGFLIRFKGNEMDAEVEGGIFDPEGNEQKLLIKAATYHNLSVRNVHSMWEATVIFDI